MNAETQKCPMCAEEIPLAAATCEYCGARFEVTSTGYCQNCHQVREADENGCCKVCNGATIDRRVDSRFLEEPIKESASTDQPTIRRTNRNLLPWGILAGVVLIISIGGFLFLSRNDLPAAPNLVDTPTPIATSTFPPTSTPSVTPTPAPTHTPRPTPMPTADHRILNPANQHLYLYVKERKTWHEARDYCAARDGHLVTIQGSSENKFVYDLAVEYNSEVGTWLGATDEEVEGTWVWVTGETWNYSNWLRSPPIQSEPDNIRGDPAQRNEDVRNADFLTFDFWDRVWQDWTGDSEMYFVCEWEP